jgi:hypothetical protein
LQDAAGPELSRGYVPLPPCHRFPFSPPSFLAATCVPDHAIDARLQDA